MSMIDAPITVDGKKYQWMLSLIHVSMYAHVILVLVALLAVF